MPDPPEEGDAVMPPARHGGQVWLIRDDEDPARWDARWTDERGGVTMFAGTEGDARAWAAQQPASQWFEFSPAGDDWVAYDPAPDART